MDDLWEPRQNIHTPDLIHQFHDNYPSAIQTSYINPLDSEEDHAPSALNSSYPPLIPLPKSPLSYMSVSNGIIQTVVQGHRDETDTPPKLVTGTLNDNEAMTLISTPLFIANTSLNESGGDTDSRSDDGRQGGSGQTTGRSTTIDEHPHVPSTHSPPLTAIGCCSAWYAPTTSSNPATPPSYVPFPNASAIPTPMYDQGTNQTLY